MKSFVVSVILLSLSACASPGTSVSGPNSWSATAPSGVRGRSGAFLGRRAGVTPITNVIIIVQENRTPDNLFQGLPGADTQSYGLDSKGDQIPLHQKWLGWPGDISHEHPNFLAECNANPSNLAVCQMNGWNLAAATGAGCQSSPHDDCPYAFVPHTEAQPYFDMAAQFAFGDRMFQTNEGPSFPAHQEIISGTASAAPAFATRQIENNPSDGKGNGGCDSMPKSVVETIALEPLGAPAGKPTFPCFDRQTLGDLLTAAGVSWRYYQCGTGAGLWHAYDAIQHIREGSGYSSLVIPKSQQILSDIKNGKLAAVSWVMPDGNHSDHPGSGHTGGPSWVAAIVNAVGKSQYWDSTTIIVTWDDWGGFFDHVAPDRRDNYDLGFRVPLLLISPYVVQPGYVSHVQHEFGSILHFTEETFGTGNLGTTDATADDLQDSFDYTQPARSFTQISAPAFTPDCNGQRTEEDP
ncbi:MAG: alkaline phosphatase family protein [Candidatus Cybelea sp.]|jgi:phospholipase C